MAPAKCRAHQILPGWATNGAFSSDVSCYRAGEPAHAPGTGERLYSPVPPVQLVGVTLRQGTLRRNGSGGGYPHRSDLFVDLRRRT